MLNKKGPVSRAFSFDGRTMGPPVEALTPIMEILWGASHKHPLQDAACIQLVVPQISHFEQVPF
jgi:hypothetical protein